MGYFSVTTWHAACDRCGGEAFDIDPQVGDTPFERSTLAERLYEVGWRVEGEVVCTDCMAEHGITQGARVIPMDDAPPVHRVRRRPALHGVRLPGYGTVYVKDRRAADGARARVAARVRQGGRITREGMIAFARVGAGGPLYDRDGREIGRADDRSPNPATRRPVSP